MSSENSFTGSQLVVLPKDYFEQIDFVPPELAEEIEEAEGDWPADLEVEGMKSSLLARATKHSVPAILIWLMPFACF